jgi:hypothetical protein
MSERFFKACDRCHDADHCDPFYADCVFIDNLKQDIHRVFKLQIEKMRNCDNCKHGSRDSDNCEECDFNIFNCPCDKWEFWG